MPRRPWLTTRASEVFALAHDLVDELGHDDVTPVHMALGLVRKGPNVAVGALFNRGVPLDVFERELEALLPHRERRALRYGSAPGLAATSISSTRRGSRPAHSARSITVANISSLHSSATRREGPGRCWLGTASATRTYGPRSCACTTRSPNDCLFLRRRPNKRLKLAGALVLKESLWVVPWRARDVRPLPLRRRADRPQLKRDPLGDSDRHCLSITLQRAILTPQASRHHLDHENTSPAAAPRETQKLLGRG